jgi:hypothetical protein
MSSEFEEKPFSDAHLRSPEYRQRLMRKLNTLIAVLEVACAKVRRSLAGPDPDTERLSRIHANLRETLQVCMRARRALQNSETLPEGLPFDLQKAAMDSMGGASAPRGSAVEMSSADEAERFDRLGPIDPREVRSCDLEVLCRQLIEGAGQ